MVLTKDMIISAQDRKVKEVDMTEYWGGTVYVRTLSAKEKDEFEAPAMLGKEEREKHLKAWRMKFAGQLLSDEKGNRLFSDPEVVLLAAKNFQAIDKIIAAGRELNGLNTEALEQAEKNLEQTLREDSGLDLPPTSEQL